MESFYILAVRFHDSLSEPATCGTAFLWILFKGTCVGFCCCFGLLLLFSFYSLSPEKDYHHRKFQYIKRKMVLCILFPRPMWHINLLDLLFCRDLIDYHITKSVLMRAEYSTLDFRRSDRQFNKIISSTRPIYK